MKKTTKIEAIINVVVVFKSKKYEQLLKDVFSSSDV
jgi:hypothetical protein